MDIKTILEEYDQMFEKHSLQEIEKYLLDNIHLAKNNNRNDIVFTLTNEIIGFYRDTTQKDKSLYYCEQLLILINQLNIKDTFEYATALLNIANAYRAFELYEESIQLFNKVNNIYYHILDENNYYWATLYNNWALVYQEINEFSLSVNLLKKAMKIIDTHKEAFIQSATTRVNLASSLIQMNNQNEFEEAILYLKEALKIFEDDGCLDFHYGGALVTLGDAYYYQKDYYNASNYYKQGLIQINKHVGKTDNYDRVFEKYQTSLKKIPSLLQRSKLFYEEYGKEIIEGYEDKVAVGIVGEGSDCFGYDDYISSDHDYEIGFCIWLKDEDYFKYGELLQDRYNHLIIKHGYKNKGLLNNRRGVMSINKFYNELLNTQYNFENNDHINFNYIDEYRLSHASNGEVFYDGLGLFTQIRNHIEKYYDENTYREKLAQEIHNYSQYAQSNYARMMARGDIVSASICKNKAIESSLNLVYLLERKYAPYYKWKAKGLINSHIYKKVEPIIKELIHEPIQLNDWSNVFYDALSINMNDHNIVLFEKIAKIFYDELIEKKYIRGTSLFLEEYIPMIIKGIKEEMINKIIKEEYIMFDNTNNIDGRASCQNDYETFYIMRKSQYETWNVDLLESYYYDLMNAKNRGWNLITEKYARMMESNDYEGYLKIKDALPQLDEDRIAIQEEIIKIQVGWMQEFSLKYPFLSSNARNIHSYYDDLNDTSYETYLRGEISTYSISTLLLYGRMIVDMYRCNRNIASEIIENTVKMYGYDSLDKAESQII